MLRKTKQSFAKDGGGNNFAVDLVGQINLPNQGIYMMYVYWYKADFVMVQLVIQKTL
jgi:hypothetical protein